MAYRVKPNFVRRRKKPTIKVTITPDALDIINSHGRPNFSLGWIGTQNKEGMWLVPITWKSFAHLLDHQYRNESLSDTIIRLDSEVFSQ